MELEKRFQRVKTMTPNHAIRLVADRYQQSLRVTPRRSPSMRRGSAVSPCPTRRRVHNLAPHGLRRYSSDQPYTTVVGDGSKRIAVLIYTTHGRGIWLG